MPQHFVLQQPKKLDKSFTIVGPEDLSIKGDDATNTILAIQEFLGSL